MEINDWHNIEYADDTPGSAFGFTVVTGGLSSEQVRQIAEACIDVVRPNFGHPQEVTLSQVNRQYTAQEQIYMSPQTLAERGMASDAAANS